MFRKSALILIPFLWACNGTGSIQENNKNDNNNGNTPDSSNIDKDKKDMAGGEKDAADADVEQPLDLANDGDANSDKDANSDVSIPTPIDVRLLIGEGSGKLSTWNFNQETRLLTALDDDSSARRITWVAKHPDTDVFYTTSDQTLRAYSIDEAGTITFQTDAGVNPGGTHVDIDKSGRWAIIASYNEGSVEVVSLDETTKLPGSRVQLLDDANFCIRAHQVRVSDDNKHVYVPCLGHDHIRSLELDSDTGTLARTTPGRTPDGAGPRHMDFHPTLDFAYVLNENSSSITRFAINGGVLSSPVTTTTLPSGTTDSSASSDIHISQDGKFLYAVNRQPLHQIAVFKIDVDGGLTLVEHVPGEGEHSRSFAISPDGKSLLMGNTNSSNLVIFERDPNTGKLTFKNSINLDGGPMFVGFL